MSFLPEVDPFTGTVETYSWNEATKSLTIARTQDCTPILDANKAMQNDTSQAWKKSEARWMQIASIPNEIIAQWLQEGINVYHAKTDRHGVPNEHMKRVLAKLADPDWRYLKTTTMRLGR